MHGHRNREGTDAHSGQDTQSQTLTGRQQTHYSARLHRTFPPRWLTRATCKGGHTRAERWTIGPQTAEPAEAWGRGSRCWNAAAAAPVHSLLAAGAGQIEPSAKPHQRADL